MEIKRDLGGMFTWTDVITGVAGTRTEYAQGTGVNSIYSAQETAWKDGTITLAQSSVNTGTTDVVSIYLDGSKRLCASVNGTITFLASA